MERRWTIRTKLSVDVDIFYAGKVTSWKTRDIGLGGVFVETDSAYVEQDENIDLVFNLQTPEDQEQSTIRAKVVRLEERGAGLMFKDFDAAAFRALQKVMRYKDNLK